MELGWGWTGLGLDGVGRGWLGFWGGWAVRVLEVGLLEVVKRFEVRG